MTRRRWTVSDIEQLTHAYGRTAPVDPATLARRLDRTTAAVKLKAYRLGLASEGSEPRYGRDELAAGLGVTEYRVRQWRERGWLRADAQTGRFRRRDVRRFLAEHPGAVRLADVSAEWFLELVMGAIGP